MALRIRISGRAAAQIRQLDQWWAMHRLAAPDAVLNDIEAALSLLAEQPGIGTSYESARLQGVRRLFLSRLGHFVYYRATDETLDVLAVWHASRERQPLL
jgi:plasmid stabilization system protein ParE